MNLQWQEKEEDNYHPVVSAYFFLFRERLRWISRDPYSGLRAASPFTATLVPFSAVTSAAFSITDLTRGPASFKTQHDTTLFISWSSESRHNQAAYPRVSYHQNHNCMSQGIWLSIRAGAMKTIKNNYCNIIVTHRKIKDGHQNKIKAHTHIDTNIRRFCNLLFSSDSQTSHSFNSWFENVCASCNVHI